MHSAVKYSFAIVFSILKRTEIANWRWLGINISGGWWFSSYQACKNTSVSKHLYLPNSGRSFTNEYMLSKMCIYEVKIQCYQL